MSESETFIEQWERLGDGKTQLLEELILVQADDIGKLDINEVMLRYFENRQRLSCDSWDNDNQALRQLFSASCRVPRVRLFPGSAGRVSGGPKLPTAAAGVGRRGKATAGAGRAPLTVLTTRGTLGGQKQQQKQQQQQPNQDHEQDEQHQTAEQLAEHLLATEDTYEGIERELAALSEQLVAHSLSQAVYNSAVHKLAVRLVHRALDRASEQLGGRLSTAEERDAARIDAIAQELARSQERGDPRELTFATERAESVAEGLLDQVMADAVDAVASDD